MRYRDGGFDRVKNICAHKKGLADARPFLGVCECVLFTEKFDCFGNLIKRAAGYDITKGDTLAGELGR